MDEKCICRYKCQKIKTKLLKIQFKKKCYMLGWIGVESIPS